MEIIKIFLLSIFFIGLVSAIGCGTPHAFYGKVYDKTTGELLGGEYTIEAEINGEIVAMGKIENGTYGLDDVFVVLSNSPGEIKFYVNGVKADESFDFDALAVTELDLHVENPPESYESQCGDRYCGKCQDSNQGDDSNGNEDNSGGDSPSGGSGSHGGDTNSGKTVNEENNTKKNNFEKLNFDGKTEDDGSLGMIDVAKDNKQERNYKVYILWIVLAVALIILIIFLVKSYFRKNTN